MLELKNVSKFFDDKSGRINILDNVSLTLPDTGFIALCGKSGCGKTTLLKMITGIINDYQGEILYDGENIKEKSKIIKDNFYTKNIFYLKYNDNFFANMKVKEIIRFYLNKDEIGSINYFINKFNLKSLLNKHIKSLSSGELQKISLSIALAKKAPITILDEPICNMDVSSIEGFMNEIKKLSKLSLVIYVSHFERDMEDIYDIKLRMFDGKFNIENKNDIFNIKKNSNIENKFNIKKSVICERHKPLPFYILFRLIIIFLMFLTILRSNYNKITKNDVYENMLQNMSINIVEGTASEKDYSCLKNKKINLTSLYRQSLDEFPYNIVGESIAFHLLGFGVADDYQFAGFNSKLNKNELIISDYIAYKTGLKVGDTAKMDNLISYDVIGIKWVEYTIKYVYKTDYAKELLKVKFKEELLPDLYKYAFISKEDYEMIGNICLNGFGGCKLDNGISVVCWNDEYGMKNTIFYDYPLKSLASNEFYANVSVLKPMGLSEILENSNEMFDGSDKLFDVTFTFDGKIVTKKLYYRGLINTEKKMIVSESLYEELKNELGWNSDNWNYKYANVKTLDLTNKEYKNFCDNELYDFSSLTFINDSILTEKYAKIYTNKSFLNDNALFMYLFGSIFLVISLYEVYKIEKRTFIMLREKNFSFMSSVLTTSAFKAIIWLFIIALMLILNFNMIKLLI